MNKNLASGHGLSYKLPKKSLPLQATARRLDHCNPPFAGAGNDVVVGTKLTNKPQTLVSHGGSKRGTNRSRRE